jgi:hypothetical protein
MKRNSHRQKRPQAQHQPMVEYKIIDGQHGGLVVSTFAHPSQWRADSRVIWNMEHTSVPVQVFAATFNPNGVERFESFPMQAFFWLEQDFGTVPIGQNQHGLVRMPPRPAPDALANLVIPSFRGNHQNLRVTGVHPVSNLWEIFNDPPPQQGESLMACVEYEENGRTIEEEFYGVYDWNQTPGASIMQTNWGFARLFSFRAERGQLDGLRETFWQIAVSLQPNPQWRQLYDRIVEQLNGKFMERIDHFHKNVLPAQRRAVEQNIANNAKFIAESNARVNNIIEQTRREIRERSQTQLTPQEQVGYLLRDQTAFHDPNSTAGNPHVMQGHAQYVWTDNRGNYFDTDNPMDDPNHKRPGHWVRATPV